MTSKMTHRKTDRHREMMNYDTPIHAVTDR